MSAKPSKVKQVSGKMVVRAPENVMDTTSIEQAFGRSPFTPGFPTREAYRLEDNVAFELNPGPGRTEKVSE